MTREEEAREFAKEVANKIMMDARLRQGSSVDTIQQALLAFAQKERERALEEVTKEIKRHYKDMQGLKEFDRAAEVACVLSGIENLKRERSNDERGKGK